MRLQRDDLPQLYVKNKHLTGDHLDKTHMLPFFWYYQSRFDDIHMSHGKSSCELSDYPKLYFNGFGYMRTDVHTSAVKFCQLLNGVDLGTLVITKIGSFAPR
jgi:hypothetical protein